MPRAVAAAPGRFLSDRSVAALRRAVEPVTARRRVGCTSWSTTASKPAENACLTAIRCVVVLDLRQPHHLGPARPPRLASAKDPSHVTATKPQAHRARNARSGRASRAEYGQIAPPLVPRKPER